MAAAGCSEPDPVAQLASARQLIERKDFDAARLELKTLLQTTPDSAEGRFLLGKLMVEAGEMASGEAELRRALEFGRPEVDVLPLLAEAMLAQGKGQALLMQFGKVELPDPGADAALRTHLAAAASATGDLELAENQVQQVLARTPEFLPAKLLAARLAASRGDASEALRQVDALLAVAADNADAWSLKGELLMRLAGPAGDIAPALDAYRKGLALDARNVVAQSAVITALIARDQLDAASAQWAEMRKVLPNQAQTLFLEGLLAEQRGDLKRAREVGQQLLKTVPDNPRILFLAGQTEFKLGSFALAETHLAKVVRAVPNAATARRLLATAQLRSGQIDRALVTLAPLLEGESPDAQALTVQAQALTMKGDLKGADAAFNRAARLKPDDLGVQTALAIRQLAKGQDAAGLAALEAIAAKDKGSGADLALVTARLQRNDTAGALAAIDALGAKTPNDPLPDQLRGSIALRGKDAAAARQHFERALQKNGDYLPALNSLASLDIAEKKTDAARKRFEAVLDRNPRHVGVMLATAELVARSDGKLDEVVPWLERAIQTDPTDVMPRLRLIDLYLIKNRIKLGLGAAQAAISAIPDNPDLTERLGRLQLMAGSAQQAVTSFTKLTQLQPRSPQAQLQLAEAQAQARNFAGVATAIRRAVEIAPNALPVLQAAAGLALTERKPDEALQIARKVQALAPGEALGFMLEGEILQSQRQWDTAIAAFRKALGKTAPEASAQRLYTALSAGRKPAEADTFAQEWRKSHPDDIGFVTHVGVTAMGKGQVDKAEAAFRYVVEHQPTNALMLNNLAYLLASQKKAGATAFAERALAQLPDSPVVLDTLALCLIVDKQIDRAIEVQARAASLAPGMPIYRLRLARLYLQAGNKPSARDELDALAALGNKFRHQDEVAALKKVAEQ